MSDTVIKIENLKKKYQLGTIGGTSLNAELQSWWAKKRGKADPNLKLGQNYTDSNKSFYALDGINLEVKKGEALGIIGANGAGKSTLLKILSRVTAPTEGDIWINGRISSMLEVGTGFHGELTGRENIYMNGAILGMSRKEIDAKMESIINFSECEQFIDTPVKRYSSGMYVKLAFAVASHLDSEIMVMDEILAVGDMKFQKKCLGKMSNAASNESKTVLYVSHNMSTIRNLCTRCLVLDKGRLIFDGEPEKAISIYSDVLAGDNTRIEYQFDQLERRAFQLGKIVNISSLKFIDTKSAAFRDDKEIIFDVKWRTQKELNDLHFRIVLQSTDTTVIGMAESPIIIQGKKVGEHITRIRFNPKNLVEGNYLLILSVNGIFENGEYDMRDEVPIPISFSISENAFVTAKHSKWIKSSWGNVRFDPLIINESIN